MTAQARSKRRRQKAAARSLCRKRLLLLATSFVFTIFALEIVARSLLLPPVAYQLREQLYVNALPRLASPFTVGYSIPGQLPREKEPGEVRVVVLGESSVEGVPFGPNVSPVAMLHDMLTASLPERRISVINMGRASSLVTTTYYHLIHILRYEPDIVIFYLGANDMEQGPGEQCMMGEHPTLYSMWRKLVENSALLWVARVLGPSYLSVASNYDSQVETCDHATLRQWYGRLAQMAAESGAEVVITSPVLSSAALLEPGLPDAVSGNYDIATMAPDYRELVRCRLQPGCDFLTTLREVIANRERLRQEGSGGSDPAATRTPIQENPVNTRVWRDVATAAGCRFIDFRASLLANSPGGILYEKFFTDEVHLTVRGYLFLARHWHDEVVEILSGRRADSVALPTEEEVRRYRQSVRAGDVGSLTNHLRRGWFLTAIPGLENAVSTCSDRACPEPTQEILAWLRTTPGSELAEAVDSCSERACSEDARVLLGWLRTQVGLDPAVDAALRARVTNFRLEATRPPGANPGDFLPTGNTNDLLSDGLD